MVLNAPLLVTNDQYSDAFVCFWCVGAALDVDDQSVGASACDNVYRSDAGMGSMEEGSGGLCCSFRFASGLSLISRSETSVPASSRTLIDNSDIRSVILNCGNGVVGEPSSQNESDRAKGDYYESACARPRRKESHVVWRIGENPIFPIFFFNLR